MGEVISLHERSRYGTLATRDVVMLYRAAEHEGCIPHELQVEYHYRLQSLFPDPPTAPPEPPRPTAS